MPQVSGKSPIDNYEIYAGSGTTYWVDTTHYVATVPAGKIWQLYGGWVDIENNATCDITIKNASDKLIMLLLDEAASTSAFGYPDPALLNVNTPIPMKAGWYVEILFGAAQSTAAFASCIVVEEIE